MLGKRMLVCSPPLLFIKWGHKSLEADPAFALLDMNALHESMQRHAIQVNALVTCDLCMWAAST